MRPHLPTLLLLGIVAGCRPHAPAYDPLSYLAVGVDPIAEADHEERALHANGFAVTNRVDGRTFVALGAYAPRSQATAVRIITGRGIAMGIDAPMRDRPTWRRVQLIEPHSGRDLDGDGEADVVVRVTDAARPAPCFVVVRVRDEGDAFEVPIDARAFGPHACPEEIVDVEGDGSIEFLVGYRPWIVRDAPTPTLPIPFAGRAGSFEPASEAVLQLLARSLVPERAEDRNLARAEGDVREVVRLSLEIAWLDGHRGRPIDVRRAELAEAIAGLTLDAATTELVRLANEHFE